MKTREEINFVKKHIKKYHSKSLKDVYDDLTDKLTKNTLASRVLNSINKMFGINKMQNTISFINMFRAIELMDIELEITYKFKDLNGNVYEYVVDSKNKDIKIKDVVKEKDEQ